MITLKQIQESADSIRLKSTISQTIRDIAFAGSEVSGISPERAIQILYSKRIPFRKASEDKSTLWYLQGKSAPEYQEAINSAANQLAEAIYEHLANKGFTEKIENAEHRINSLKAHLYQIDLFNIDEPREHESSLVSHIESQLQTA